MKAETTARLYRKFSDRLRQFIRRRIADDAAADDILQDVFLRIHSRIETLRDRDKIESWIFQITRNAISDHYRNLKATVEPSENIAAAEDEQTPARALASGLAEMIQSLPEHYREALQLTEEHGIKQRELAKRLGVSVSGAKSRVQRARARLRDLLMECCHFEFDRYGAIIDYHPRTCRCCSPL